MRTTLKVLAGALLLALVADAAPPPPRKPAPTREADQLDYLFLGSDAPVRLRLHLRVGDRPYDTVWSEWLDQIFDWFDKDKDGTLSAAEVARIPQGNVLFNVTQNGFPNGGSTVPMGQVDANKDGVVSRGEFKNYYRNNNVRPLQFSFNNQQATTAKQVNDTFYRLLDKDGDGRLTEEEMTRLPSLVARLDENEDEQLTSGELNTNANAGMYGVRVNPRMRGQQPVGPEQGLIEIPDQADAGKRLAGQIISKYDADKNGKLSRKEIAFNGKTFDRLDKNKDNQLDAAEVAAWFAEEPDLIFVVRVGNVGPVAGLLSKIGLADRMGKSFTPDRVEVANPRKRDMPLAARVKKIHGESLQFALGDTRFHVQGMQGQTTSNNNNGIRPFLLGLFDGLADKKGYITKEQRKDDPNGQNQFVFQMFDQADKNADGKLTKAEFISWLDLAGSGSTAFVSLQVEDLGRGLFDVIDGNNNTQLSPREMLTAWQRMKPLAKDGKGLAVSDLPRTMRVTAAQGPLNQQSQFVVVFAEAQPPKKPLGPGDAPPWFRKMDRNGDQDLTPKEWLGTDEEFREIDTNGDGLISVEEAKAFDAKMKAKKK